MPLAEQFTRTAMLLGAPAVERLLRAHVAVFGVGGVGSFCVEALARAGVGSLSLFDPDTVAPSNLNRQLIALHSTLGQQKVEAARNRILDIHPQAQVFAHPVFYSAENAGQYDLSAYDYIVDAIDTVSSKLLLIERARAAGTPVLSCMGTGNKLDPSRLALADISETSVCPLARVMRYELKKRGISHLRVVYSPEPPCTPIGGEPPAPGRRQTPGSVSFVPSAAGLLLAAEVVRCLTGESAI